jgi:methionyl-tRNA synthetase
VNPEARAFYFIGKDNIFFHTALWPAELMGAGKQFLQIFSEEDGTLNVPYDKKSLVRAIGLCGAGMC